MNKLKLALIGVALALGVVNANAYTEVSDILSSSYTYKTVVVSTSVPTPLFVGTLQGVTTSFYDIMTNRKRITVLNTDTSSTTFATCVIDISSTLPAGYLSGNQVEYGLHPATTTIVGQLISPQGFVPNAPWNPKLGVSNGSRFLIPWCLCYGNGKAASSCNLEVIQESF